MATVVVTKSSINVENPATAGLVVSAGHYAIASYLATTVPISGAGSGSYWGEPVTMYFGPGQTVTSTFNIIVNDGLGASVTIIYSFASGVYFVNT